MKVLFVAPNQSSFIKQDYNNLSSMFDTSLAICWTPKQIYQTVKRVTNHDICFFWFASIRFIPVFFLAKLMLKKTIVVAGGYDVSTLPDSNYGGLRPGSFFGFVRKCFLQNCDKVITVSNSNTQEAIENAKLCEKKVERIYLGFEKPKIDLKQWDSRKNQVVLIASCDKASYKIKGFDTFLALAKAMPEFTFIHIGNISVPQFQRDCYQISNIRTLGYVENMSEIFSEILNESKIILLPSIKESFGVSILEGCLHGCVPVVSNCYSLPEITGAQGKICEVGKAESYSKAIYEILSHNNDAQKIQDYYLEKFHLAKRKESLSKVLRSIF